MSEPTAAPSMRSVARRTTSAEPSRPVTIAIPIGQCGAAKDIIVTVTANGDLTPRDVTNSLSRAVRIGAKAVTARLDLAAFLTLLEAITTAAKLATAGKETKDRINRLLTGSRMESAADPQITPPIPISNASPPSLETRNE